VVASELSLRDLELKLLTPDDEPLVRRAFMALSRESRYLRYGLPMRETGRALDWVALLGEGTHVALGACGTNGEPVGVARYVRSQESAEVAVTVVDDWQGRGIGSRLLDALCTHARAAGLSLLRAAVLAENERATRLIERAGGRRTGREGFWLEFELPLLGRPQRRLSGRQLSGRQPSPGAHPGPPA
jgi:RimJ/RimL family protein N-acetyltransferase